MRALPLDAASSTGGNHYEHTIDDHFQAAERDPEASIVAELAVRLLELKELTNCDRPVEFLRLLIAIDDADSFKCGPNKKRVPVRGHKVLWVLLDLMSGDLSALTRTYKERGQADGTTKQNAQQVLQKCLQRVELANAPVAAAIRQLIHTRPKPDAEKETDDDIGPAKRGRPRAVADDLDELGNADPLAPPVAIVVDRADEEEVEE